MGMAMAPLLAIGTLNACDWAKAATIAEQVAHANTNNPNETNTPTSVRPTPSLTLRGEAKQSAIIIGKTEPFSKIDAGGIDTEADANGDFVFGLDRDAPSLVTITATAPDGRTISRELQIAKRQYRVTVVNGLPPATVNPPPEAMERIAADSATKQQAFSSRANDVFGFKEQFAWPLQTVRVTSNWGAQRKLNGEGQRPHYGIDLGGARGTPIYAPASGRVILAQTGMHFEGGMVAIDHGQGLISVYLHQSRVLATVGQIVAKGDKIGEIGAEGRATGPHLCWRMRWRGRQVDPSNLVSPLPIIE